MAAEQSSNNVALQELKAQPVVSIRGTIRIADLGAVMGDRLAALSSYLRPRGAQPAGPPYVRYHTFGETETDLETGIPVVEPLTGEGRIAGGERPGGPAIATWHIGAHDRLGDAYARLHAWLTDHGRAAAGAAWEEYHWIDPNQTSDTAAWQDTAGWRTRVVQPITPAAPR
jgi:effector-binding domain-containing protein